MAGSFNKWGDPVEMTKEKATGDVWTAVLKLPEGRHEYVETWATRGSAFRKQEIIILSHRGDTNACTALPSAPGARVWYSGVVLRCGTKD